MITLKDIQYVITIAEEGTYSKAASKLFISQSALSQDIGKLEKRLGVQLFERRGNSKVLSPTGQLFVNKGAQILYSAQILENQMHALGTLKERNLRIGISQFYSLHYFSRLLPVFTQQYPSVNLEIVEDTSANLEKRILDSELNLALIPMPLNNPQLQYSLLNDEKILLAVPCNSPLVRSHDLHFHYNSKTGIDLKLAANEDFIFLHPSMRFTRQAKQLCHEAGFEPHIVYETKNWDTAHAFVRNGLGVTFIPDILLPTIIQANDPVYFHLNSNLASRPYVAIYRSRATLSNIERCFLDLVCDIFDNIFPKLTPDREAN